MLIFVYYKFIHLCLDTPWWIRQYSHGVVAGRLYRRVSSSCADRAEVVLLSIEARRDLCLRPVWNGTVLSSASLGGGAPGRKDGGNEYCTVLNDDGNPAECRIP
ncbi:hypothetical protein OIDMADRAFT_23980 [Oidiodendron maius Zn]|uniref:Uncharacterized protein n=1 Tax=Oidiodendron maius (strain Zn) TaxID=913774 RepID=A0A0C3HBJ3_OIDMZ|nr:hypothetical protein OIDMADRAFT_23980 [Oidiodendron maius Zn]